MAEKGYGGQDGKKLGRHLSGRSRSNEKDNDSMESACKERSFPGRLENQYFKYNSLLGFSNRST